MSTFQFGSFNIFGSTVYTSQLEIVTNNNVGSFSYTSLGQTVGGFTEADIIAPSVVSAESDEFFSNDFSGDDYFIAEVDWGAQGQFTSTIVLVGDYNTFLSDFSGIYTMVVIGGDSVATASDAASLLSTFSNGTAPSTPFLPGTSISYTDFDSFQSVSEHDEMIGGSEANAFYGGFGNDTLFGGNGSDFLVGGASNDTIDGGNGFDTLYGNNGRDVLTGGAGNDILTGGGGNDKMFGGNSNDTLFGGNGNDSLNGGAGSDRMVGGQGIDYIFGESGADYIVGDAGADRLHGGQGADILIGGVGNDRFIFSSAADSLNTIGRRDTIVDFTPGQDRIDLSDLDAGRGIAWDQAFNFRGTGRLQDVNIGQVRFNDGPGDSVVVSVDVDADGRGDMHILVQGVSSLSASDFIL